VGANVTGFACHLRTANPKLCDWRDSPDASPIWPN
jgi:hypothetical protein